MGRNNRLWLLICVLQVLLLLLVACNQAPAATPTPTVSPPSSTPTPEATPEPGEPVLSDVLIGNCTADGFASDKIGLPVGEKAINFTLKDVQGTEVRLSRLLAEKPVVLIFGSFT